MDIISINSWTGNTVSLLTFCGSANSIELDILTEPYLRLAHFQSTIIAEYISKDYFHIHYGDSKNKCMELYSEITKEWKRPDWPAFMKLLEKKYNGMLDMNSFNSEFSNKFENSNRNYAHVSFGFETTVYLPIDVISKFEKNNSSLKDSDKLARFIMKIVDELLEKIG